MGLIESIFERLFPPTPESLSEVRPGRRAVVRGRVVARDLIESPLSGVRGVYYRYLVEEWRRSGVVGLGATGFWVIVEHDEAIAEFYLDDGSGRAVIAPEGALVHARAFQVDVPSGRRASEARFGTGALVEVMGVAEEIEDTLDDARGYRESPARLLLRAPDEGALIIRVIG